LHEIFLLLHLVNALFWLFHIHIYVCVYVQEQAYVICMTDKIGGGGRDIGSFMATVHKKTPMQLATWMCSSRQTFWTHTLSLSLGLVIHYVAGECIYTHSEFKKLGVLSLSQTAWGRESGVKSVIVVYVPKHVLSM